MFLHHWNLNHRLLEVYSLIYLVMSIIVVELILHNPYNVGVILQMIGISTKITVILFLKISMLAQIPSVELITQEI